MALINVLSVDRKYLILQRVVLIADIRRKR